MKALELLKDYKSIDFGCNMDDLHSQIEEAIEELEALATTQQTKTSTSTNLIYCPLKNSKCILSKCAAYTTHKEPDIMKCDTCGDTFRVGQRCKNYIKGKPDHIKMSRYKNMAYCKHFKCYVFI